MKLRFVAGVIFATLLIAVFSLTVQQIVRDPSIVGKAIVSTQLIILERESSACNISFKAGWNLVSFDCIADDISYGTFFENSTKYPVREYLASDSTDPWKSMNPSLPAWVINDFTGVSKLRGYWIYSANDSGFIIDGALTRPSLIILWPGWNLMGYPSKSSVEINQTFGSIIPYFDYVETYNISDISDPWKQWTWNMSLASTQDLNRTSPTQGYWIYSLQSQNLVVP